MNSNLIELAGETIPQDQLTIPRAAAFVRYVLTVGEAAFELVECRRVGTAEVLFVLARPSVPQRPKHDVRYEEPLAVVFDPSRERLPDVLSLRVDFPQVSHLNIRQKGHPKSLCLFVERPEDLLLSWTPALLGERILWWLKETAYGTLHKEDQALEPFFGGVPRPLIIPPDIFASVDREILAVYKSDLGPGREVLIAEKPNRIPAGVPGNRFTLLALSLPPQEHGVIRFEPQSLQELHVACAEAGFDLLEQLRIRLQANTGRINSDHSGTILLLGIPKLREVGASIESTDLFAFRCRANMEGTMTDIGPANLGGILKLLGNVPSMIAGTQSNQYAQLLISAEELQANSADIGVTLLLPQMVLTAKTAAVMSGLSSRSEHNVVAIGQGALGSQVFENLARQGWGQWTLIDEDYFAPHNAVRHAIWGRRYGLPKAKEMASRANELFSGPPLAQAIVSNIIHPGENKDAISTALAEAELVLDMSASVPVARHLALDIEAPAKRVSAFLNPAGTDLVVMTEDIERTILLDSLECQYLRHVLHTPELSGHLAPAGTQTRYSRGCNDLSAHISQETVALHAAIAARAVRTSVEATAASTTVWQCSRERMEVARYDLPIHEAITHSEGEWTVVWDTGLRQKLLEYRVARLPRETCGILLGYLDTSRQRIYICDVVPAPPDSVEERNGCQRGTEGMKAVLVEAAQKTLNQVTYIGEWHSHPDRIPCQESAQDQLQMQWVKSRLHPEGRPALILIACQNNTVHYYLDAP